MRRNSRIQVTPPRFELYEQVTLWWNGKSHATKIVQRWYNPDEECWLYRVNGSEALYSGDVLETRLEQVG